MPTQQSALYDQFYTSTVVGKQRFVELFNGTDIDTNIWFKDDVTGTNTYAMTNSIDEGYSILTGATNGNLGQLTFNNIRPIDNTSSTMICTARQLSTSSIQMILGLTNSRVYANDYYFVGSETNADATHFLVESKDTTTTSRTSSATALDTAFHTWKGVLGSSTLNVYLDGVLNITKSTNLPTVKLEPVLGVQTGTSASKEMHIKYLEVFNQ